jgi:hypothetical protein
MNFAAERELLIETLADKVVANVTINEVMTKKKPRYILSLNLRDIFVNIPYDLLKLNLQ